MTASATATNHFFIKLLTFVMFLMFAMTTDSVGVILPEVIRAFPSLTMTAAGAFHYANMSAIAVAAIFLGFLADRLGRKRTIVLGLTLFALNSYLFVAADSFAFFITLLAISGASIGIFKTGALALIGDISNSTAEHTSTMNLTEGFFGVGAILGPAIVARLIAGGVSWKFLYVIAGSMCVLLIAIAAVARYPQTQKKTAEPIDLKRTMQLSRNPFALGFSLACFLYVAVECAIYVWLPTYLKANPPAWAEGAAWGLSPAFMTAYAVSIFFILRAAGRFLGAWVTARWSWTTVLVVFSGAILACFAASLAAGPNVAVFLLPASGLFMSVIYPTLNSKGISRFPKAEHGTVAGVILFFTCAGAALGPLAMGAASDLFHGLRAGFALATAFAALLFGGMVYNWLANPARARLATTDESEYGRSSVES